MNTKCLFLLCDNSMTFGSCEEWRDTINNFGIIYVGTWSTIIIHGYNLRSYLDIKTIFSDKFNFTRVFYGKDFIHIHNTVSHQLMNFHCVFACLFDFSQSNYLWIVWPIRVAEYRMRCHCFDSTNTDFISTWSIFICAEIQDN